ncbi:MAG: GGDEF domain-containing protein [Desulfobacterales bacterium]|nr:GGDEF domain-containing protein [Desulfobacterales bacterium]
MQAAVKLMYRRLTKSVSDVLGLAPKVDYKTLSRYLIGLNQMQDLDGVLREAAKCLRDVLNSQLFAFALQDEDQLDVWIDPRIYKKHVKNIIRSDFEYTADFKTHFFAKGQQAQRDAVSFNRDDLMTFILMDEGYFARLYLVPDRKILQHNRDTINIIIKTLGVVLTNVMNIKRLKSAVAFDPLTNCYNRREFNRLVDHNIAGAQRHGKDLSIIMFDIDHFKKVNDTYGHQAGDTVLQTLVQMVMRRIRKGDYLCRFGGEEFVIVLPETKKRSALMLAEQLRQLIAKETISITDGHKIQITASFGIASLGKYADRQVLIREADTMLYQAKANGRNLVMPQLQVLENNPPKTQNIRPRLNIWVAENSS